MALKLLPTELVHTFIKPVKRIHEGQDVTTFLVSVAYHDVTSFLVQLNHAMFPRKNALDSDSPISTPIARLKALIQAIDGLVDIVPLDPGTHRFGNTAFRKWFQLLEESLPKLLQDHLPQTVLEFAHKNDVTAVDELQAYLYGSFGSAQRLDYGTGHELSFLAFLAGIWKLGGFGAAKDGSIERSIVLEVIDPYLVLIRKLILKYSLEPAGSHGVWGLDDHSFLPYIFGSAQYGPEISENEATPTEGSKSGASDPGGVVKSKIVDKERKQNLYFGAIGFIYDVKTGPFWEHSPTLFDISGVKAGWGKINKGMLKMYDAEVLGKFPVVQHFPFGSLFSFDRDPRARESVSTVHTANQPRKDIPLPTQGITSTAAPWANKPPGPSIPTTAAPWSRPGTTVPPRSSTSRPTNDDLAATKAPWAK